jgi:hypothetical protein
VWARAAVAAYLSIVSLVVISVEAEVLIEWHGQPCAECCQMWRPKNVFIFNSSMYVEFQRTVIQGIESGLREGNCLTSVFIDRGHNTQSVFCAGGDIATSAACLAASAAFSADTKVAEVDSGYFGGYVKPVNLAPVARIAALPSIRMASARPSS